MIASDVSARRDRFQANITANDPAVYPPGNAAAGSSTSHNKPLPKVTPRKPPPTRPQIRPAADAGPRARSNDPESPPSLPVKPYPPRLTLTTKIGPIAGHSSRLPGQLAGEDGDERPNAEDGAGGRATGGGGGGFLSPLRIDFPESTLREGAAGTTESSSSPSRPPLLPPPPPPPPHRASASASASAPDDWTARDPQFFPSARRRSSKARPDSAMSTSTAHSARGAVVYTASREVLKKGGSGPRVVNVNVKGPESRRTQRTNLPLRADDEDGHDEQSRRRRPSQSSLIDDVSDASGGSAVSFSDDDGAGSEYDPEEGGLSQSALQRPHGKALSVSKTSQRPIPAKLDLSKQPLSDLPPRSANSMTTQYSLSPTEFTATSATGRPSKSNSTLSININGINASAHASANQPRGGRKGDTAPKRRSKTASAVHHPQASARSKVSNPSQSRASRTYSTLTTSSTVADEDIDFLPGRWAHQHRGSSAAAGNTQRRASQGSRHNVGDGNEDDEDDDDEDADANLDKIGAWSFPSAGNTISQADASTSSANAVPGSQEQIVARRMKWKEAVESAQAREADAMMQKSQTNGIPSLSFAAINSSTGDQGPSKSAKDVLLGGLLSSQAAAEVLTTFQSEPFGTIEEFDAAKRELKRLNDRLTDKKARLRTLRRLRGAAGKLAKSEQRRDTISAGPVTGPSRSTSATRLNGPPSPVDSIPMSASNLSDHSTSFRSMSHLAVAPNGKIPLRTPNTAPLHSRTSSVATASDFGGPSIASVGSVEAAAEQVDKAVEEIFALQARIQVLTNRLREHVARVLLGQISVLERGRITREGVAAANRRGSQASETADEFRSSDVDEGQRDPPTQRSGALQDDLSSAQTELQIARNGQMEAEKRLDEATRELDSRTKALSEVQSTLKNTQRETDKIRIAHDDLKGKLAESEVKQAMHNEGLSRSQESLQTVLGRVQSEKAELRTRLAQLEADLSKQSGTLRSVTSERDALQAEQSTLRREATAAKGDAEDLRNWTSTKESQAKSATARYDELELAVSAERKLMAERDTLFHAFETRLERAEDTLRALDRRCAALLGKTEGREELDDFLAKIRGGNKATKKTAGQDIDDLLRGLAEHVEDLADELSRRYQAQLGEDGAEREDDGSEFDEYAAKPLARDFNAKAESSANLRRIEELQSLLEQSRQEVVDLQRQVDTEEHRADAMAAEPPRSARTPNRRPSDALEARLNSLREENEELRTALAASQRAAKDTSGGSTTLSDSSLVKVAGSRGGLSSGSDGSECDEPFARAAGARKGDGASFVSSPNAQRLLNDLTEILPLELEAVPWKRKHGPLTTGGQCDMASLRGLQLTLSQGHAERANINTATARRDVFASPAASTSSTLTTSTALNRVRCLREAARMAAEHAIKGEDRVHELRQRIAHLEQELETERRSQASLQGDGNELPPGPKGLKTAKGPSGALGDTFTGTGASKASNQGSLLSARGRSLSRLRPNNDATPSFFISQPLSADRTRPNSIAPESPTALTAALPGLDLCYPSDGVELLSDALSSKPSRRTPTRRSTSAGIVKQPHKPGTTASGASTANGTPWSTPTKSQGGTDHGSSAAMPSLQRSITLGLSTSQLVSRIRQLECELQSAASLRRAALEQVAILETQVKEVEKHTEERMRSEEVEARVKMLEQMNDMNAGLSLGGNGSSSASAAGDGPNKALPLPPAAAGSATTPSPRNFTIALPFVGRTAAKSQ
ncbi:unnamed protein product [Parajaminaea phylloscopi]